MAAPRIHAYPEAGALAGALAGTVADRLAEAVAAKGTALLAVSGGSTPGRFFEALSAHDLPWEEIVVTLVDERLVPPSSPRANARLVGERLLRGPAAKARFVPLWQGTDESEQAALLARRALVALPFPLDVAILGMGPDGHTASFFPDAVNLPDLLDPAGSEVLLPVVAASGGEPRLTLTLPVLISAGFLALHIEGEEKKSVLDRALAGVPLPVAAVLEAAARPMDVYWAP